MAKYHLERACADYRKAKSLANLFAIADILRAGEEGDDA